MHGRPRVKSDASLTEAQKLEQKERRTKKATLFGELCKRVLEAHASNTRDAALLKMSEKLVAMNPEMYTVWNYRRAHLSSILSLGGDEAVETTAHELTVTERALMQNPKSYATFHHRKWVVSCGYCSLERELALVETLLDVDERNFHGWGYRRAIVGMMGLDRNRELAYSRKKIEDNFSNYSAWHHRSVVLGIETDGDPEAVSTLLTTSMIEDEFQFVRQACYTDPRDQSGWFYHRWLTGKLLHIDEDVIATSEKTRILRQELEMCRGVHELDTEAKWPVLIAKGLVSALQCGRHGGDGDDEQATAWLDDKDAAWLEAMDPMRAGFYRDGVIL